MIDHRPRRVSRSRRLQVVRLLVACGLAVPASSLAAAPSPMASPMARPMASPMASPMTGPIGGQDDGIAASLPGADAMAGLASLAGRWTLEMPDGTGMRAEQTVEWDEAASLLRVEWNTTDGAGRTLAQGRGRIGWDDIAGAVVNTYAGRDGDRRFSGSATLIAIDGAVSDWRGHETRGSGGSVNFEVTYDLRDDASFVVDFIPTCLDGLETLAPVRFAWSRVDPFVEALPNADELAGEWTLVSGGHDGMPDGSTMAISRGAGGRSLVFVIREPGTPAGAAGAIMGIEQIWFDADTGSLHDRFISVDGSVMTAMPTIESSDDGEMTVVSSQWTMAEAGMSVTSRMWVDGDDLHVAFADHRMNGETTPDPPAMLWKRR